MLKKIFGPLIYLFTDKKKLIVLVLFLTMVFGILIFPYDDMSDMITALFAKNSHDQVFVQFDDLGIGFLPPSLKMSNVTLDTPVLPTLKAKKLYLAPNIAGLLAFSPGFSASIEDVLKGDIHFDLRAGKKVSDAVKLQNITLKLKSLDLKSLTGYLQAQVDLEGAIGATIDAAIDPTLVEQPDGEVTLDIDKFRLPTSTVPTMLGPVSLPNTEISHISLKGQLKGGNLDITDGVIGQQGDTINGKIKGRIGLRLIHVGNQVAPEFGAYEFKIDLNFDRAAEKNFGLFLNLFDKYRTVTGAGSRYAFRLSAQNFNVPPNPTALGSW